MKNLVLVARVLLGGWMLFWGVHFFAGLPEPMGTHSRALRLAMADSGLFTLAKAIEVFLGVTLLGNRFVPAALVIGLPVTINIAWIDLVMERSLRSNFFGAAELVLHVLLMLAYLRAYLPMLAWRVQPSCVSGRELSAAFWAEI